MKFIKNKKAVGIILISQLAFTIIVYEIISNFFEKKVQTELFVFLNNQDLKLKINGKTIRYKEAEDIINEIKKIDEFPVDHPNWDKKMKFEIKSKTETQTIRIIQNSRKKNEFWVFSDKYKSTKIYPFGQLNSNILMKYYN